MRGADWWSTPSLFWAAVQLHMAPYGAGSYDRKVSLCFRTVPAASYTRLGDFQCLLTVAAFAQQCRLFHSHQPWTRLVTDATFCWYSKGSAQIRTLTSQGWIAGVIPTLNGSVDHWDS